MYASPKFSSSWNIQRVAFLNCRTKRSRNVLFWDRKTEALRTFSLLSLADRLRCYLYYYPISEFCSFSDWFSSTQFPNTFSLASFQYQPATCHNLKKLFRFCERGHKGRAVFLFTEVYIDMINNARLFTRLGKKCPEAWRTHTSVFSSVRH